MMFFYNLFIRLLIAGMKIGSAFNYKLKKGLAGRRQSCETVQALFTPEDLVIWMHAASLGEYEQGLPVLEELKRLHPHHKILVTFFSPSGYDHVVTKNKIADVVCYLPFDIEKWVQEFTASFKTDIFFTVKYDYWYHLLRRLKQQGAQVYVVSALFYETQVFFKAYGKWFVKQLRRNVDFFFHQTQHSSALAKSLGLQNSMTTGDTRYDRVKTLRDSQQEIPYISHFKNKQRVVIFGSSWETEERIAEIISIKNKDTKIIIAPHDLKRVPQIRELFPQAILYSGLNETTPSHVYKAQVLIVDCIGLLSSLYRYGDIAVVGGGFHSKGLHNILEAAAFGLPVFFGNQYYKNPEADELVKQEGGKCFEDEFFAATYILSLLDNREQLKKMSQQAYKFIASQPNATATIVRKMLTK